MNVIIKSSLLAASTLALAIGLGAAPALASGGGCGSQCIDWKYEEDKIEIDFEDEFDLDALGALCPDQYFDGDMNALATVMDGKNKDDLKNTATAAANIITVDNGHGGYFPHTASFSGVQESVGTMFSKAKLEYVEVHDEAKNSATAVANVLDMKTTKLGLMDGEQKFYGDHEAVARVIEGKFKDDLTNSSTAAANIASLSVKPHNGTGIALVNLGQDAGGYLSASSIVSGATVHGTLTNSATSVANVISVSYKP